MADSLSKYILTVFGYGSGMGAAQTARHTRGLVTRQAMKRISDQHITIDKLDAAIRDIVNQYIQFRLPLMSGTGKHAVADGTHIKLIDKICLANIIFAKMSMGLSLIIMSQTHTSLCFLILLVVVSGKRLLSSMVCFKMSH